MRFGRQASIRNVGYRCLSLIIQGPKKSDNRRSESWTACIREHSDQAPVRIDRGYFPARVPRRPESNRLQCLPPYARESGPELDKDARRLRSSPALFRVPS